MVIGIGEKKTPNPFIVACDKFIYIEIIGAIETKQTGSAPAVLKKNAAKGTVPTIKIDSVDNEIIILLKRNKILIPVTMVFPSLPHY